MGVVRRYPGAILRDMRAHVSEPGGIGRRDHPSWRAIPTAVPAQAPIPATDVNPALPPAPAWPPCILPSWHVALDFRRVEKLDRWNK